LNPPLPVEVVPPPKAAAGKGKETVIVVEEPVIEEVKEEVTEVINPLLLVTPRTWRRKECEDILLHRGLILSTLINGSFVVDVNRGELWQAAIRNEQAVILCFKVREQALKLIQTAAMAEEEDATAVMNGGDMLMPLPPSRPAAGRNNNSSKILLKSGSTTINKLRNNVLNNSSSKVDVCIPNKAVVSAPSYRSLKLTEERLHAHEQAYALSSNHGGSTKQNNGVVALQPIDAKTEMKNELWRQKKIRGQQKMTISKKLTALAALCS